MKAAIYLRTSTEEQNPELQQKPCEEFAQSRGYDVAGVFLEQLSGYKQVSRPFYDKVKEMARNREIDAVIVWALDRWVRNRDTLLDDVVVLRNYGVKIHSVKEAWLEAINIDGPLGRTIQDFLLGLVGSLGEIESQLKSERIKMAFTHWKKVKHGHKSWGRPKIHTNKKKLIYELLDYGISYRQISARFNISLGEISKIANSPRVDL